MKKNNTFKTLLLSFLVSGCALFPNSSTTSSSENKSTGETFGYNEIKDLLENGYKNFKAHDGVSIKLANSSFSYLLEEFSYSNDKVTGKFEGHVEAKDVNLEFKLNGLKTATKVNDFNASAVASGDLHVFEVREGSRVYEGEPTTRDLAKGELDAAVYFDNGKFYTSLGEFYKDALLDPIYPDNFYIDLGLEGVEGMLEEMTGLAFPVLSDANIEALKSMIDESMEGFDFETSFGFKEETFETLVNYVLTDLFTANKQDNNYYLNLNLTKDNLANEVVGVFDKLYETGFLAMMSGEEEISKGDYEKVKADLKTAVQEIADGGFNHFKLNIGFTNEMIKTVSLDVDMKIKVSEGKVSDGEETHLSSQDFITVKSKVNYEFDYSDNVNVTFPNFDSYVDYEEYFSNENIVKYINDAAKTNEPFDSSRVYNLLGGCCDTSEYLDTTSIRTYYPEYDDYIDLAIASKNGAPIETITVVYDEDYNAISATYANAPLTVDIDVDYLIWDVYDHSYDELVAVFGEPKSITGEITDQYFEAQWMMNDYRGFEVYFEYGVAYDYSYLDFQY